MAPMIEKFDLGYVNGATWHNMPQFQQLNRYPTLEEARKCTNFRVDKQPMSRLAPNAAGDMAWQKVDGVYCLTRMDHNHVIYPSVGEDFVPLQNDDMLTRVDTILLRNNDGKIEIDSVGTLQNGRFVFINLKISDFKVAGDSSDTVNRILIANVHGGRKLLVCLHNVRVVCMNTLRMAEAQATKNGALKQISHVGDPGARLSQGVVDLMQLQMECEVFQNRLKQLAQHEITPIEFENYIACLIPIPDGDQISDRTRANRFADREQIRRRHVSDDSMTKTLTFSWYGALQAATGFAGEQRRRLKFDQGNRLYEGLYGDDAKFKDDALKFAMQGAGLTVGRL